VQFTLIIPLINSTTSSSNLLKSIYFLLLHSF
jgi:hypothetical protein